MFKKARYVCAIYREGSITRAAERLYVSQPCLSTAIKQLERELGFPLFERTSSSVKPTELGLEYIRVAEKIIALEDGFASRVRDVNSLEGGVLRVGGSNYVSSYILPKIVDKFSRLHPPSFFQCLNTTISTSLPTALTVNPTGACFIPYPKKR